MGRPAFATILTAAIALLPFLCANAADRQAQAPGHLDLANPRQTEAATQAIGTIVASLLRGKDPVIEIPVILNRNDVAIYVAFRQAGRKLSEAWSGQGNGMVSVRTALAEAQSGLRQEARADAIELVIAFDFEPVPFEHAQVKFPNLERGISGIELRYGDEVIRRGPTEMIAANRSFARVIERFAERHKTDDAALADGLILRRFAAHQFLVLPRATPVAIRMFRGNEVLDHKEVTRTAAEGLARRMTDWMITNVRDDGRMTYKYWPSSGKGSSSNNMIRQWMASLCLVRLARFYDDPALAAVAERNIRYNLERFYRAYDGLGAIEFRGKAKLGAISLAALALAEHPNRLAFRSYETALRNTIVHLWNGDGSFRTFFKPSARNDNQNFYPGEALLYLAKAYRETGEQKLLNRLLDSVRHYWSWHLANRNPAFVPWHSMAYFLIWRKTGDRSLAEKILDMNDWLLTVQQEAPARYPDIDGRFYDPEHREFGPPHASSTGVYLEGLIKAYRVARSSGQTARAEAYRLAILRGLRSLMQLEFRDEADMFYISKRERVRGGIRTTAYNNEVRVDNVQHGLMALLDILDTFGEAEFRH
ncbi:MAG: hypothetical protein ACR2O4_02155 [Hyphomicrobiaceae bacterium]